MTQRPHEKLIVWQEAYKLSLFIYKCTDTFPTREQFGLTQQMRSAAVSVPSNIAEGNAKRTIKDLKRFLNIAKGSLEELHCQCRISTELQYMSKEEFLTADQSIHRVSYLLSAFRSAQ